MRCVQLHLHPIFPLTADPEKSLDFYGKSCLLAEARTSDRNQDRGQAVATGQLPRLGHDGGSLRLMTVPTAVDGLVARHLRRPVAGVDGLLDH